MPEISPAEAAPGEATSRLDPRTKLLALLVLNALVMRASPTSTLLAVQLLAVVALAWEVGGRAAVRTGLGCLVCDALSLGSPLLVAWLEAVGSPRGVILVVGTCAAILYWFARFFAGFGIALYVYRTTRIGQMKAALRAVHLPRVFVDALVVAFRVLPTVGAEAVAIREAMEMRGVDLGVRGVLRHPLVIAERFCCPPSRAWLTTWRRRASSEAWAAPRAPPRSRGCAPPPGTASPSRAWPASSPSRSVRTWESCRD